MPGHLGALVPGQRLAQVRGQVFHRVEEGPYRVGVVPVRQRDRAQEPADPLDQVPIADFRPCR